MIIFYVENNYYYFLGIIALKILYTIYSIKN
nr:MAG TPA: hypothetical protein [Caudoviricetes sp.]